MARAQRQRARKQTSSPARNSWPLSFQVTPLFAAAARQMYCKPRPLTACVGVCVRVCVHSRERGASGEHSAGRASQMKPLCALYLLRPNKSSNDVSFLFLLSLPLLLVFSPSGRPSFLCAQQRETFPAGSGLRNYGSVAQPPAAGFEGLHDSAGRLAVPLSGRYLMCAELIVPSVALHLGRCCGYGGLM